MNSSAMKTALSFLAAAALGAAVFACTTSSSTVDDTDGGTQSNDKDSGVTTNPSDSGTGSATCESTQQTDFGTKECQSCIATSCCTEVKTCFGLAADADGGKVDCNGYKECIDTCNQGPESDLDNCYKDCDDTANEGVQAAYEAIESCAVKSCAAACGVETPDGG